jgi:energy-coupling factor transport system permease protein
MRGLAVPVLEGALERSLQLAASMDSRGYGRQGVVDPRARRIGRAAMLVGMIAAGAGAYGLAGRNAPGAFGPPALVVSLAALTAALVLGGHGSPRTRYRPDPWRGPEWATVAAGIAALGAFIVADRLRVTGIDLPIAPLAWPALPLVPLAGALVAVAPAFATPRLPAA